MADGLAEAARRMVETSCEAQGLEVQITDPVAIGKVAAILRVESDPPARCNAARIELGPPSNGGIDRDRLEDRKKDGALAA